MKEVEVQESGSLIPQTTGVGLGGTCLASIGVHRAVMVRMPTAGSAGCYVSTVSLARTS